MQCLGGYIHYMSLYAMLVGAPLLHIVKTFPHNSTTNNIPLFVSDVVNIKMRFAVF